MNWSLNTTSINDKSALIIENLQEESIAVFCFIQDQKDNGSVTENKLLQFIFRSFYRLDNAGLTNTFKNRYFQLLEDSKSKDSNLRKICEDLYEIKNHKDQNTLQFSFATKLINTLNPKLPIYDLQVAKMYAYKNLPTTKPFQERLESYMSFYEHLDSDYQKIFEKGLLQPAISKFDNKFEKYKDKICQNKKLDFILWSAGKLA